ncbi:MAG: hypothetical protein AAF533_13170 [Acidobacteriota bacterium]
MTLPLLALLVMVAPTAAATTSMEGEDLVVVLATMPESLEGEPWLDAGTSSSEELMRRVRETPRETTLALASLVIDRSRLAPGLAPGCGRATLGFVAHHALRLLVSLDDLPAPTGSLPGTDCFAFRRFADEHDLGELAERWRRTLDACDLSWDADQRRLHCRPQSASTERTSSRSRAELPIQGIVQVERSILRGERPAGFLLIAPPEHPGDSGWRIAAKDDWGRLTSQLAFSHVAAADLPPLQLPTRDVSDHGLHQLTEAGTEHLALSPVAGHDPSARVTRELPCGRLRLPESFLCRSGLGDCCWTHHAELSLRSTRQNHIVQGLDQLLARRESLPDAKLITAHSNGVQRWALLRDDTHQPGLRWLTGLVIRGDAQIHLSARWLQVAEADVLAAWRSLRP